MIHIFNEDGCYEVWLDTEVSDKDGLCIGCNKNRHEAIMEAQHTLMEAVNSLPDFERYEIEDV